MNFKLRVVCLGILTFVFGLIALPTSVFAYIGPGTGISAIGSFLALIAAICAAILGFIWYPLKRILKKIKGNSEKKD